jgi:hypothetical protein
MHMFAVFVAMLLVAQRPQQAPPPPVAPEVLTQFDFLEGDWDFTYTALNADGSKQISQGRWTGRKLGDGRLIEDSWVLLDDQGKPRGAGLYTFRVYNPFAAKWQYRSVNLSTGLWQEGTGEKIGEEMHLMQSPPKETSKGAMLRIRYYNIAPKAFSWVADASLDAGQTWNKEVLRIEAKRR